MTSIDQMVDFRIDRDHEFSLFLGFMNQIKSMGYFIQECYIKLY